MLNLTNQPEPSGPGATVENEVQLAQEAANAGDTSAQYFHLSNAAFLLDTPSGDAAQAASIEAELAAIRESW